MNNKAMYNLTYGLFLLTAKQDGRDNGCIINTAVQVANEPTRISISVINNNLTCDMIKATGEFNITSLTTEAPFDLFQRFGMQSGRGADKFDGFDHVARSENGLLYLTAASNAFLSAKVVDSMDLGSHTLFIAEVTDGEVLGTAPSVTYSFYQSNIKPKPPKPTAKTAWVCVVCGYVYEGDEVPDDYECPLCHHGKKDFVPMDNAAGAAAPAEAKPAAPAQGKWVCSVCGYVYEGAELPSDFQCPLCGQGAEVFDRLDAPTEAKPAAPAQTKWVCSVCGYVYEGAELPSDFQCPLCRQGAEVFTRVDAPAEADAVPAQAKWVCSVCGYVYEGAELPSDFQCPLCGQGAEVFTRVDAR